MNKFTVLGDVISGRRQAVVVLGMHRSGTSLLSALLCTAGADAPNSPLNPNEFNETGYWEPWRVQQANDDILSALGVDWQTTLAITPEMLRSPAVSHLQPRMVEALNLEFQDSPFFCLKDPRMSRVLPIWEQAFTELAIAPVYVIAVRNPLEVAESLKRRDGFHRSKSLMLWLRHTLDAEFFTRGRRRVFVTYDDVMFDWMGVLRRISQTLDIVWGRRAAEIDLAFDRIISPRLRHHHNTMEQLESRPDLAPWVLDTYRACLAAANEAGAGETATFERIQLELQSSDMLIEPILIAEQSATELNGKRLRELVRDCERSAGECERLSDLVSSLQSKLNESERECERLQVRLEDVDKNADAAAREQTEMSVQIANATAEIERLQTDIAHREELATNLQCEINSLRSDIEHLTAQGEQMKTSVAERDSRLQALHNDLVDARAAQPATEFAAQIEQLTTELTQSRTEADAARNDCAALRETVDREVPRLSAILQQAMLETETLRAALEARERELASTESLRVALADELTSCRNALAARERDLSDARGAEAHVADELKSKIQQLTVQVIEVRSDYERAESAKAALQSAFERERDEIERASRVFIEVDELRAEIERGEIAAMTVRSERDQLKSDLEETREVCADLTARLIGAEALGATLAQDLAACRDALEAKERELADARISATTLASELATQIEQLKSVVVQSRAELALAEGERTKLRKSADRELNEIGDKLNKALLENESLLGHVNANGELIDNLRVSLESRQLEINKLRERLVDHSAAASQESERLSAEIENRNTRLVALRRKCRRLQRTLEMRRAKFLRLQRSSETEKETLKAQVNELSNRLVDAFERARTAEAQALWFEEQSRVASARLSQTAAEFAVDAEESVEQRSKAAAVEAEREALSRSVASLEERIVLVNSEMRSTREAYIAASAELECARLELEAANDEIASLKSCAKIAQATAENVETQLNTLRLQRNRAMVESLPARAVRAAAQRCEQQITLAALSDELDQLRFALAQRDQIGTAQARELERLTTLLTPDLWMKN